MNRGKHINVNREHINVNREYFNVIDFYVFGDD